MPLLHDAAGASSDAAQAAWRAHAAFGPVWGQWVGALRAACPQPLTSLHAAVLVHSAAEGRPFVWPERPFRGLQGDSLCTLAFAVEALARADGYLAPAVQEALLCVYGGDRLASEIAEGARHLCAPPAPVPPTDRGAAPAPEADVLSEVAAAAAPRRRARRPRARAPRTSPPPPRPDSRADALWATRDLADEFQRRVYTLQAPPPFLRGALRAALHAGLARIRDDPDSPAGWGLFLLAPRMLLFRRRGETRVARDALEERAALLARGAYADLLDQAAAAAALAPVASPAPRGDCLERRAARAAALAHMGELSAAAAALTAPALAPATAATLAELRDPARRPPSPQVPLPAPPALGRETAGFGVDHARLLANLRRGRRGAAPGLSGCTPEHLRVLLDDAESLDLLCFAADRLARAEVPPEALAALRLGRLVALQKPAGGVRGLVMGDAFRRLVAKTLAQQFAGRFAEVCAPFQYALAARAGTESLARAVRLATELDPRTTVLSIDGVGAYDHISRASMFLGLRDARVAPLLPFVSQFYGAPSRYTFYDEHGAPHDVWQGEGGEQGDPLMPALYAVGQHAALLEAHSALQPGEHLYAYLDDVYATCAPDRVGAVFGALRAALRDRANVHVHLGKTRAWNAAGEEPTALLDALPPDARPTAWAGNWAQPPDAQGLVVLGTPLGSPAFVASHLHDVRARHDLLLDRVPTVPCLQSAWLLLLLCSLPRCNYLLRALPPADTGAFAAGHDAAVLQCLTRLLGAPASAPSALAPGPVSQAQLPLHMGGLGLRSALATRSAAHWASWADSLPVIGARHPLLLARVLPELAAELGAPGLPGTQAARLAAAALHTPGWAPPSWVALASGLDSGAGASFGDPTRGWQRAATAALDRQALEVHFSVLDPASRALLLSQGGAGGAAALTVLPSRPEYRLPAEQFRVLLLRRLRLPLPPTPRLCRCGGALDPLGDHRAACPTAGVLVRRAAALERAAAAICREAGARVATNVFLRDLNIGTPLTDGRRLEVVANGLPGHQGAQVAVDVTLVSPVARDGTARARCAAEPGAAAADAAARKRRETYPEFAQAPRARLAVLALETGGRRGDDCEHFLRVLAAGRAQAAPPWQRPGLRAALHHRWGSLLSLAAQGSLATTLLELPEQGGGAPPAPAVLADLTQDARLLQCT